MANESYKVSHWGSGVLNNAISWGISYYQWALRIIGELITSLSGRAASFGSEPALTAVLQNLDDLDLLDEATIVTTPTAYSNGILHSVKPVQYLGAELVTNGGFDTDTNFTKQAGWTINMGVASCNGTNLAQLYQSGAYTVGQLYIITYDIVAYTSGGVYSKLDTIVGPTRSGIGSYTDYIEYSSGSSPIMHFRSDNFIGSIDNISVKEVIDADYTYTRASSGTRVNEQGLVESVAANLPRFTWEGGKPSLLLEPQSTNLVTGSTDFTGGSGATGVVKSVDNTVLNPFGVQGAIKLSNLQGAAGNRYWTATASVSPSTTYTVSVYLKATGSNIGKTISVMLKRTTGTFFAPLTKHTLTAEWKRVSLTATTLSDNTNAQIIIENDNDNATEVFVANAQLEALPYATSYIPTVATAVTRSADLCVGAGSSALINSVEGTLFAEIAALADTLNNRDITVSDGTTSNSVKIRYSTTTKQVQGIVTVGGVVQATLNYTLTDPLVYNKIAVKWKLNDFALYVNGVSRATDVSGSTFTASTLNKVSFSDGVGTTPSYSKIRQLQVFNRASTDTEAINLTTL